MVLNRPDDTRLMRQPHVEGTAHDSRVGDGLYATLVCLPVLIVELRPRPVRIELTQA